MTPAPAPAPVPASPDPDVRALAERFAALGIPPVDAAGVIEARAAVDRVIRLQPEPVAVAEVRDTLLAGAAGRLPARVHVGGGPSSDPPVLHLHGGGWALGGVAVADRPCREIAADSGATIVSPEYRRAPETPFPGPLEDCLAVARGLVAEHGRIVLLGDSAGGNLAAACAQVLRDEDPGAVLAQILVYPCLAAGWPEPSPGDTPFMSARELDWLFGLYLDGATPGPLAAPLLAEDLAGLPPTTIHLAERDPLREEGLAYAARLEQAGVPVSTRVWAGQPHGFWWMGAALPRARELSAAIAEAIREALA